MSPTDPPTTAAARPGRSVLLIEDNTIVGMGLKAELERQGHHVVGQAATGAEAQQMFRALQPDLLLVDIRLDGDDGISVLEQLTKERRVPAIVVSAYSDAELIDRASAAGVFGYLIKPVSPEALAAQIEIAVRRFDEQEQLLRDNQQLTQTLTDRKDIERAKGIYMKLLNLSEPDAHRKLQQESQKRRLPIADLARKIIESEDLLGGG